MAPFAAKWVGNIDLGHPKSCSLCSSFVAVFLDDSGLDFAVSHLREWIVGDILLLLLTTAVVCLDLNFEVDPKNIVSTRDSDPSVDVARSGLFVELDTT